MVFGERNRGNVYNLLKQIPSGLFLIVGSGNNVKSMAYVENVAAFIEYMLTHSKGYSVYNYMDKPDLSSKELASFVKDKIGKKAISGFHWPYWLGYMGGAFFDGISALTGKKLPISRIPIKKFCATTQFYINLYKYDI